MIVELWEWLVRTNPDAWAAGAGWTTTAIAFVASIAAFWQVREARKLREAQAQPYVVAYMEQSQADMQFIDLVIKNFGTTAARDVRIYSEPVIRRSTGQGTETEDVGLFKVLPILVPQQEWRTFWDSGLTRKNTDLPDEHMVTVEYKDYRGRKMEPTQAVLDWSIYKNCQWLMIYGPHHSAKALREIRNIVKNWSETGGGLRVYARDGDRKDARVQNENERKRQRLAELRRKLLPQATEAMEGAEATEVRATPASPAQTKPLKQEGLPESPPPSTAGGDDPAQAIGGETATEASQRSTALEKTEQ